MFYFEEINGKKVMKSSILDDLNHFFTTRETIIKTKEPDKKSIVSENLRIFCEHFKLANTISPHQTHSANVRVLDMNISDYPETDGLIIDNNVKNSLVYLNFADCTPLIFYDGTVSAIAHAGWRGTAGSIAKITVEKMIKEYNSKSKNIRCAIGPAISMCCYNVKSDVSEKLLSTVNNQNGLFETRNGEIFVSLKDINKRQLEEIGLYPENIDVCPYCTVCDNDKFFSYRKENGTTNRHSAVIVK